MAKKQDIVTVKKESRSTFSWNVIEEYEINYLYTKDHTHFASLRTIKYRKNGKNNEQMDLCFIKKDYKIFSRVEEYCIGFSRAYNKNKRAYNKIDRVHWTGPAMDLFKVKGKKRLLEKIVNQLSPEARNLLNAFRNSDL